MRLGKDTQETLQTLVTFFFNRQWANRCLFVYALLMHIIDCIAHIIWLVIFKILDFQVRKLGLMLVKWFAQASTAN